jgi:hypothetical protein
MSSARANAAARQRRAEPQPTQTNQSFSRQMPPQQQPQLTQLTPQQIQLQQQQRIYQQQAQMQQAQMQQAQMQQAQMQQAQMQQGQPQGQGQMQQGQMQQSKLSISDAIALTTLRLGRVENMVQNLQNNNSEKSGEGEIDSSLLVDIQSRLNLLENWQKSTEKYLTQQVNENENVSNITTHNIDAFYKNNDETINHLKNEIVSLKGELSETKKLLLNLQSFTMQTNQKLVDVVFNDFNMNGNTPQFNFLSMDSISNILSDMDPADLGKSMEITELQVEPQPEPEEQNLKRIVEQELNG